MSANVGGQRDSPSSPSGEVSPARAPEAAPSPELMPASSQTARPIEVRREKVSRVLLRCELNVRGLEERDAHVRPKPTETD
jgi:hypothetical protein